MDGEKIDTPVLDDIINQATDYDKKVRKLLYEVIGYIISQGVQAKKFFVFADAPDSGKSVIGDFIGRLIGDENSSNIALGDLGSRFSAGTFGTKFLNYNMDLSAGQISNDAATTLKILTGDRKINCEEKYVQAKSLQHNCKFLFASNHPIVLKNYDNTFFERLVTQTSHTNKVC